VLTLATQCTPMSSFCSPIYHSGQSESVFHFTWSYPRFLLVECVSFDGCDEDGYDVGDCPDGGECSLSLWRVARGSKHMFLELIHGLFIT
jgi:hypothetical protein